MAEKGKPHPIHLTARQSRDWWRALMENVADLLGDADVLLERGSYGRARSLSVLAREEVGKAKWIFDSARFAWAEASAEKVVLPGDFAKKAREHPEKLKSFDIYSEELGSFWGEYSDAYYDEDVDDATRERNLRARARQLDRDKQAGFYVDRRDSVIYKPSDIPAEGISDLITEVAGVAEMMLITDHTDMKYSPTHIGDSTNDLQMGIMPFSHPQEFLETIEIHAQRSNELAKDSAPEEDGT